MADPINSGDTWAVIRGKFNSLIADVAAAVASVAGKLTASLNLSDLPDKAAARTALELGTMAQQNAGTVAISGGTISGLSAPLPIASGGTGGNTPEAAQTALGGTALGRSLFTAANPGAALAALGGQPLDAGLTSIAGLTTAADRMIYTTAADTYAVATLTAAGRAILADADAAAQRATLGAQAADATLTSLSGLTLEAGDILYATGADTLVKLAKGTAGQVLQMNSGATAPEWGGGAGLIFLLNANFAGANVTTVQDFFPQDVTLDASSIYNYELVTALTKSAGAVDHAIETLFGGTATLNAITRHYYTSAVSGGATVAAPLLSNGYRTAATAFNMTGNVGAVAAMNYWQVERGFVSINASGTFIPQYRLTVAPGGAYSTVAGSYFRLRKLGASGANIAIGPWA